jgi:signal transduction histidine kinase
MRFRTWPIAALGLAGLLLLVFVSVLTASRRTQDIYTQLEQLNAHHREVEAKLRRLRSDVNMSGIFVRDYLLDQERPHGPEYRQSLARFRQDNMATLAELRKLAGAGGADTVRISSLQVKLEDYWQAFDPLFDWTLAEKSSQSYRFLRREVIPRREAVLSIAQEIEQLNNANLNDQRAQVTERFAEFQRGLYNLLWQSLLLGLVVASLAVSRLRVVERRTEEQRAITEDAERQLRLLSQQVVATQEEERKKLSRELHDHVGQMLTALRMELGRIDRARPGLQGDGIAALAECRQLVDDMVRTVRDLALGLRPSMLDDFGLQPALEWHARDVTRRYGLPVDLTVSGDVDSLPEQYRTCIYRAVQEALTNCVKHARASRIDVSVRETVYGLEVAVTDDGVGLDPARRRSGLGLRGIEERVRELKGTVRVESVAAAGTTLTIHLPAPENEMEATLARAAG